MPTKSLKERRPTRSERTRKPYRAPSLLKMAGLADVTAADSKVSGVDDN
jgi:hypothetical protein